MINPVEIIEKKRDGGELTDEEIQSFVDGFVNGSVPDYQVSAFAMAVYFRSMTIRETTALTRAVAASGDRLDLHDILGSDAVVVDKHSSGGIGDKVTLALGPVVAACGIPVAKMSGRGLSFTGGTIDKLESIPGWSSQVGEERFREQLRDIGIVISGQTADLAPADKKLYALRDVTGTVKSLPLIVSSIMGKKLASGADAIVLDIKCGRGTFMETREEAKELAEFMVGVGEGAGKKVTALITQMEQPLGHAVGNALEVKEVIEVLKGKGPKDITEMVEELAVEMVMLGSKGSCDRDAAMARVRESIESGKALEKFRQFATAQGGDGASIDDPSLLPTAPFQVEIKADRSGWVQSIEAREIGLALVTIGGGRIRKEDVIDFRVGAMVPAKIGMKVSEGDVLCTVHAGEDTATTQAAIQRIRAAFIVGDAAVEPLPMVYERVVADA